MSLRFLKWILLSSFLFLVSANSAQNVSKIDSLRNSLANSKEDTAKVSLLNALANALLNNNPDSAIYYCNEAKELADKIRDTKGLATAYNNAGIAYDNLGNFEKSLKEYFASLSISTKNNYPKGVSQSTNDIGIIYYEVGKYDSALFFFNYSLRIKDSLGEKQTLANTYSNIGLVYHDLGNYPKSLEQIYKAAAIDEEEGNKQGMADNFINIGDLHLEMNNMTAARESYSKALALQKELGDKEGMVYSYEGIGGTFQNEKKYSDALANYKKGIEMAEEIGLQIRIGSLHNNIGSIYEAQHDYTNALNEYQKALQINQQVEDNKNVIRNLISLGNIHVVINQPDQGIAELNQALSLAMSSKFRSGIKDSHEGLAKAYAAKGDYKKAYDQFLQFNSIKDSLLNDDKAKQLAQMQTQYETGKKDQEIDLLKSQNELQDAENRRQKTLRNAFIGGFISVVIVAFLLFNGYRRKQKTNALLQEKNKIIENQKKHLEQTLLELQQSESQLVQSEKMASLGQLTAGVAHEINNPINFVSGNINPLKKNIHELIAELTRGKENHDSPELTLLINETQQLLNGIEEGSRRTAEIVRGLRSFSRADEGTSKQADIHESIDSSLLLLNNKLNYLHIDVIKSYGDLPLVNCFPGQLNQVWMNLLTNAIDAIGQDGKIFITTDHLASNDGTGSVRLCIRDTGKGMTEEVRKKIFDPFFTTKEVGKGTGLGLSISYGIIEKHKGKIDVISEVGKGTEFIVTLPVA